MSIQPSLSFQNFKDPSSLSNSQKLVLAVQKSKDGEIQGVRELKKSDLQGILESKPPSFEGNFGQNYSLLHLNKGLEESFSHQCLGVWGVGKCQNFHNEALLDLGGKISQKLALSRFDSVDIWIDTFFNPSASKKGPGAAVDNAGRPYPGANPNRESLLEKLALGIVLGFYKFDRYKSKKPKVHPLKLRFVSKNIDARRGKIIVERVEKIAAGVCLTRDLQTTPGGDLFPAALARTVQQEFKNSDVKVSVWDEKKLKSEKMNGILSVGKGSINPPRLISMEYNLSKKRAPLIVLVGKGVTFDTGGVCLKPAPGMEAMKMDMSGAASVIGAIKAIAALKANVRVVGLVGAAENMNSGSALLPGDIYTSRSGKTVEVLNTDAEGRLVLADVLDYAQTYKPDCVIDLATLTGAVLIALGGTATGLMGNNAALIDAFKNASAEAGERIWELPLFKQYGDDLKSGIADFRNIGSNRYAGTSKAAAFLNFFVKKDCPWIHLDIAGSAMEAKDQGSHCPKDCGTGVPVRSLVEFSENIGNYLKKRK